MRISKIPTYNYRGRDDKIPSLNSNEHIAVAKETVVYTGTNMIGIATLHKSNAVPVFSKEEAENISNMRR